MNKVSLDGTDLTLSRFGFGTSGLFNVGTGDRRRRLLEAACEYGFTHFDTAPYYGFGCAERDLRPLLAAHPEITVATKVGIYPPGGADQAEAAVLLRKAFGKILPSLSRPSVDWNLQRARRSLEGSLRRLGRERVDLFLLHEPQAQFLVTEEWQRWLESAHDKIAHFGIACAADRLMPMLSSQFRPLTPVVQCADSVDRREADAVTACGRTLQITYGYLSASLRQPGFDAVSILAAALRRNRSGCVLVSTRKVERLALFAEVSERDAELAVASP